MRIPKRIAKILGIVLAAVLVNGLLAFALVPYASRIGGKWQDCYDMDTLDTVVIGTSLVEDAVDPAVLDEQLGTTSINLGTAKQMPDESYLGVRTILENRDISLVILSIDLPYYQTDKVSNPASTFLREKNVHGVDEIAARLNPAGAACAAPLKTLVGLYGTPAETLPKVAEVAAGLGLENAYFKLKSAADALEGTDCAGCVRIDFSTAGDRNYYNGIAFKGYVEGVPERVLSGGQYDRLVRRFLPDGEAIGFAVYVDSLEKLPRQREEFDGDVLLIYGADAPQKDVLKAVIGLNAGGLSVKAAPSDEAEALKQRYRRTAYVDGKGDVSYEK